MFLITVCFDSKAAFLRRISERKHLDDISRWKMHDPYLRMCVNHTESLPGQLNRDVGLSLSLKIEAIVNCIGTFSKAFLGNTIYMPCCVIDTFVSLYQLPVTHRMKICMNS